MINDGDIAYARMLLGIMKECNRCGDCFECINWDVCKDMNIPSETAFWFERLINEVETLKDSDNNKD